MRIRVGAHQQQTLATVSHERAVLQPALPPELVQLTQDQRAAPSHPAAGWTILWVGWEAQTADEY